VVIGIARHLGRFSNVIALAVHTRFSGHPGEPLALVGVRGHVGLYSRVAGRAGLLAFRMTMRAIVSRV
jgi:hypothetical protein